VKHLDRGAYCLLIHLTAGREATIGRLGRFHFPKGYYVYFGSAMRGLAARIARHKRRGKKLRWHIDYFLALPAAKLFAAVPHPSNERRECTLNQAIQKWPGATAPIPGFGSSDCKRGCPAHLTYLGDDPISLFGVKLEPLRGTRDEPAH